MKKRGEKNESEIFEILEKKKSYRHVIARLGIRIDIVGDVLDLGFSSSSHV